MIKRLVSMILCIFALCQMVCVDSYAFDWPWSQIKSQQNSADPKNKCGNFEDVEYLKNKCLKELKDGKGFCRQLNIGPQCQTDLWFWDYVQIKEALSNLRKCSLNMESTIVDEIILNVADTIKALFKTNAKMSNEVSKRWLRNSFFTNGFLPEYKRFPDTNFHTKVFDDCVGELLDTPNDQIFDVYRYFRAFDKILSGIMCGDWEQGDVVSLKISRKAGKDYGEHVDFIKQGIHYDENTKVGYEDMFNNLRETLINIVKGIVC